MVGHSRQAEQNIEGHGRPRLRPWMLLVGVIGLVASHSVVLYYVQSHTALSAAVASGVIVLIVIKHLGFLGPLYALVRRRSRHLKPSDRVSAIPDQDPINVKDREEIE